jgi:pyrimidine-specific ribonucleoside hydrolase
VRAVLLGLLLAGPVRAHEETVPVIVDTDMALDDARALALLLGAPEIRVHAILTSDGACPPDVGATNVLRLLHDLGRGQVPVASGRVLGGPAPAWAERSVTLGWSDLPLPPRPEVRSASTVLDEVLNGSSDPLTWFCFGPLSNLADLLRRDPAVTNRIGRVYFCGTPPEAEVQGWNTARDLDAARFVFASGLEIIAAQLPAGQELVFDADLLQAVSELDVPPASLIARLHADARVRQLVNDGHFRAWDESLVLLLHEPWLGRLRPQREGSRVMLLEAFQPEPARRVYVEELRLAGLAGGPRPLVTLRKFPIQADHFQDDVQPLMEEILARHGIEEWKLNVLTSELHRHLGLYSILGAKMGLRARELLGASLDELQVESLAGLRPPVSCLNDGLQVATGASLGRGTIRVPETPTPAAAAVFTDGQRKLRLQVREEEIAQVRAALRAAVAKHGDLTPAYFAEVRRVSLRAWRDLDRRTLFTETEVPTGDAPQ